MPRLPVDTRYRASPAKGIRAELGRTEDHGNRGNGNAGSWKTANGSVSRNCQFPSDKPGPDLNPRLESEKHVLEPVLDRQRLAAPSSLPAMTSFYQDYPVVARRVKSIWSDYLGSVPSYL